MLEAVPLISCLSARAKLSEIYLVAKYKLCSDGHLEKETQSPCLDLDIPPGSDAGVPLLAPA